MNTHAILLALYAVRAQVDSMIAHLDDTVAPVVGGCPHPADKQVDATTLGGPRRTLCLVCQQERDA